MLPSGIEPASPVLQTGAITRSASRAKSWPATTELPMVSCPATGIVNYLIVKDHPRPSPGLLPRFIETSESFGIRVDLSRSRRPALFAGPRVIGPRNEKSRRGRLHLGGFRKNL